MEKLSAAAAPRIYACFSKRSVRAIFMSEIREHRDHQKDLRTNIDFYTESTVKTGEIKR